MKKTVCIVIILVLLMGLTSFAYADTASYRGRCINYYNTTSLKKINDINFNNDNEYCQLNSYNSGEPQTSFYCTMYVGSTIVAEGPAESGEEYWFVDPDRLYKGDYYNKIENRYEPGAYIYTKGTINLW